MWSRMPQTMSAASALVPLTMSSTKEIIRSPVRPSAGPDVPILLPCVSGELRPDRLVGEFSMLALGDLCSRLRPLGAKGEGGIALAVGTGENTSGPACEEAAAASAERPAEATPQLPPCMRRDPALVCCAKISNRQSSSATETACTWALLKHIACIVASSRAIESICN